MQITKGSIYRYKVPFTRPIYIKEELHYYRSGLIIQLIDENKGSFWGEVCPLKGFSKESLAEAENQLIEVLHSVCNGGSQSLDYRTLLPSVAFGIESALLPAYHKKSTTFCTLILGNKKSVLNKLEKIHCRLVKLKFGKLSLDDAIEIMNKCREKNIQPRIDFNQMWDLKKALCFAKHFPPSAFDFLEEPVSSFEDLLFFSKQTSFPLALDETLQNKDSSCLKNIPSLKALVIKPTIVGSSYAIEKWLQFPKLEIILSSSFETFIGIESIRKMASHLHLSHSGLGLDTLCFMKPLHLESLCPIYSVP